MRRLRLPSPRVSADFITPRPACGERSNCKRSDANRVRGNSDSEHSRKPVIRLMLAFTRTSPPFPRRRGEGNLLRRLDAPLALAVAASEHRLEERPGIASLLAHDVFGRAGGDDFA